MRYAILTDIHSNLEALETALDYLSNQKIDEYWTLGDNVGYGANPNECLEWVFTHARVILAGNHEKALVDRKILDWFEGSARTAILWTAGVLQPGSREKISKLHYVHMTANATLVHASPNQPEEFHYLFSPEEARPAFRAFQTPLCFIGHTHVPTRFVESSRSAEYLPPGKYQLERGERYILNPGAIGQPRDRDPRLAFGIFDEDDWTFEVVRLQYDNQKAAGKIRDAGLPVHLAARLLV